jgi:benzoate/toluate 1,2-dioxygenase beta subunit
MLQAEVQRLLHHEARLLDQRRFADWLKLYTDDAIYWIPRQRQQSDPLNVPSIIYDDLPLMAMRVQRLMHPRVYSAMPTPHTLHIVGSIELCEHDQQQDKFRVISSQLVVESRNVQKRIFAACCEHVLRRESDALKIAVKRIDLLDCDTLQETMVVPL